MRPNNLNISTNYYPFGMPLVGRSFNLGDYRFGFNGEEQDNEIKGNGNSYAFKFRMYDPRLGRWWTIDPKSPVTPSWSPYRFAFNNPMNFIDPSGETEYTFHMRSFIADEQTGLFFRGDGRGFTTEETGITSRIKQQFTLDTDIGLLVNKSTKSDFSLAMFPLPPGGLPTIVVDEGKPKGEFSDVGVYDLTDFGIGKSFEFRTAYEGKDPITLQFFTPAIDVRSNFVITEDKENNLLGISILTEGDRFPATEAFVQDPKGTSVFIGGKAQQGSVLSLIGSGSEEIFNINFAITLDEAGNFLEVIFDDKTFSISDWNKQFEEAPAKD